MRLLLRLTVLLIIMVSEFYPAVAIGNGEQSLLLFYSNDVLGETEPCG